MSMQYHGFLTYTAHGAQWSARAPKFCARRFGASEQDVEARAADAAQID
jgi:hypothetical protein